jgi:hypothetical protein
MSGAAGLDVRYPIGGLFVVLGLILAGYGLATGNDAGLYARSSGVNVNLWWGAVMLAFGLVMAFLAARSRGGTAHPAESTPEGRATEAREHDAGLEREGRGGR